MQPEALYLNACSPGLEGLGVVAFWNSCDHGGSVSLGWMLRIQNPMPDLVSLSLLTDQNITLRYCPIDGCMMTCSLL